MRTANDTQGCSARLQSTTVANGSPCAEGPACDLSEAAYWKSIGAEWECLHTSYCAGGVGVEWHNYANEGPDRWSSSFHPGGLEVCINLSGQARLVTPGETLDLPPMRVAMYSAVASGLTAHRLSPGQHTFLTFEYSPEFLRYHFKDHKGELPGAVKSVLERGKSRSVVHILGPVDTGMQELVRGLRNPPVPESGRTLWYKAQALAFIAQVLHEASQPQAQPGLKRRDETARLRVEKATAILSKDLANPPSLEQLGKVIGCSPYHLSRSFSKVTGMTIRHYVRKVRMEAAAAMLKSGRYNVTEAAMQVGYSSLSHFSQAFCDVMGCCPGLYPLGLSREKLFGGVSTTGGDSDASIAITKAS